MDATLTRAAYFSLVDRRRRVVATEPMPAGTVVTVREARNGYFEARLADMPRWTQILPVSALAPR